MPTPTTYHPKLSTLIDASSIPGEIKVLEDLAQTGINMVLGDIRYTNYIVEHSPDGDTAFHSIVILTKRLAIPLSKMELVFFDSITGNDYSEFPIALDWRWPIKRYINQFEQQGFSEAPEAFLEILLSMADIESEQEMVEEIINIFLSGGTTAYENALNELSSTFNDLKTDWPALTNEFNNIIAQIGNIKTAVGNLLNDYSLLEIAQEYKTITGNPDFTAIETAIDSAKNSFETIKDVADVDVDIYKILIEAVLKDVTDLNQKFDQLFELFQTWLGNITKEDVEYLLIPQFGVELSGINMALIFPREWVVPMKETTQLGETIWVEDPDVTKRTSLKFQAGTVKYHTLTGFEITNLEDLEINLNRCMIPKLEIQLELKKIKLDLSRKKNIAEATADDRPEDFVGAYIQEANIWLPEKWFTWDEDGSTLKIFAQDVLIGTGGVSGVFGLEAAPGLDARLEEPLTLKEGNKTITYDATGGDSSTTIDIGDKVFIDGSDAEKGRYVLKEGGSIFVDDDGKLEKFASSDGSLSYLFGKKDATGNLEKGAWEIGFNTFYLKLIQNKLIESEIKGYITIPKFKQFIPETQKYLVRDLKINLQAFFENDGDFKMSASPENGLCFGIKDVFYIKVDKLELGEDDAKTYIETSGSIHFDENKFLKKYLKDPIEIEKLRIYSDGSFEIEGGSIPIPAAVTMALGPVEVSITNITIGSEDVNPVYKFIGFDCGVSAGNAGLDMRGDGIKLMFNEDGSHMYLKINGIGVNLIIPATASEADAALIIKGYLSMREVQYEGGISFSLPQIGLAGGAAMKMRPKVPAFVIDSFLTLPVPIPLGPTGLGIFSFRGLFGLRYAPNLPEGALQDPKVFYGFYKEKVPNPLIGNTPTNGLHIGKIIYPEDEKMEETTTPISIGAGLTLATTADAELFSLEAFLFLSVPQFLLISGRANVMGEQVTPMSTDVPFFAYLALSKEFISVGMGADFKLSKDNGEFIEFEIEAQMAFFFNDPSAWYIHLGTKQKPNVARVIKDIFNLNAYAYLMLSAQGIQAGAGMKFDFNKKYGPVKVEAHAYLDTLVMMSFKQFQVGGGIALGGSLDIKVFGIGFYIGLDAYLMATLPKPFLIKGGLRVCVEVNLRIKKIRKCVDINFKWELNKTVLRDPIHVIDESRLLENFATAFHIGSEQPYPLEKIQKNTNWPAVDNNANVIPLDSFIDLQLNKAVNPSVLTSIGGYTNPPAMHTEFVPPSNVEGKVEHRFYINNVTIKANNAGAWVDYHPYEALGSDSFMDPSIVPSDLKIGTWLKMGKEYNKIRILANDPFNFSNHSPNNFVPEQIGMTAGTLFCKATEKSWHCETWNLGQSFVKGKHTKYKDLLIKPIKEDATAVTFQNVFNIPYSIKMSNYGKLEILLPEAVLECKIKLFSYAKEVKISFYGIKDITVFEDDDSGVVIEKSVGQEYIIVEERVLKSPDWLVDILYSDAHLSINKICVEPIIYDLSLASELKNKIRDLEFLVLEGITEDPNSDDNNIKTDLRNTKKRLAELTSISCQNNNLKDEIKTINAQIRVLKRKQKACDKAIKVAQDKKKQYCSISKEKETLFNMCFLDGKCRVNNNTKCNEYLKEQQENSQITRLIRQISLLNDKYCKTYAKYVKTLQTKLQNDYEKARGLCDKWTKALENKQKECKDISDKLAGLSTLLDQLEEENKIDKYATYIHQICWITEAETYFNRSIPSQAALEAEYDAMRLANKVIAPIWKPETQYCIEVETREEITGRSDAIEKYYIQFQTQGPIGHFDTKHLTKTIKDQFKLDNNGNRQEANEDFDQQIDIPELSLRSYINYKISYPNPDGNIINAKPLYYKNTDLNIFYNHPFVYHMFNEWPDYNGLGTSDCGVEIKVKDPTENFGVKDSEITVDNQHLSPVLSQLPASSIVWKENTNPAIPKGIEAINNLRNPKIKNVDFEGHTCWQIGGDAIIPAKKDMDIKVEHLLPSKLYNAIVFSKYNGVYKNIHSYPFQTSCFANLKEHIESYKLKGKAGDTKNAVYTINVEMGNTKALATSEIVKIILIAVGMEAHYPQDAEALQAYPNTCERIIRNYLPNLKELLPPVGTEFNYLIDTKTNHFIGIWVRSVEPLNDPRIPNHVIRKSITPYYENVRQTILNINEDDFKNYTETQLKTIVKSLFNSGWPANQSVAVFSNDRREALILNMSNSILPADLRLRFDYLLWDNNLNDYTEKQSFTTQNLNL